jgi:hypothetical protein
MTEHYSLSDVARLLNLKPYRISYALSVGLVPEPAGRLSNKRIFGLSDVEHIAEHFGVTVVPKLKEGRR